jgi:hypothetical protein
MRGKRWFFIPVDCQVLTGKCGGVLKIEKSSFYNHHHKDWIRE